MDGDRFISTNKNILRQSDNMADENNFFMQSDVSSKISQSEPMRHINDYDSNILKEDAYKDVNDEVFKLEYKIAKIENEIKEVDKQIQMADEIYDYYASEQLKLRKHQLTQDLLVLMDMYNEVSLSAKISGGVTSKIRDKFINVGKVIESFAETMLSKFPGKISSIIEIKNSLNKLESINKSVDELMKSKYPYGEAAEKYNKLSKYISRANAIQSEIYKFMK